MIQTPSRIWKPIFVLWLMATLGGLSTPAYSAKVVDGILAVVNSEIVTLQDMSQYRERLKTGGLVDEALLSLVEAEEILKSEESLLNHLINERLLDSEIRRLGIQITIERVEQEIRSILSRRNLSRAELQAALQEQGIAFSDYQDFIRSSLARQILIEREVSSKVRISDEDIMTRYLAMTGPGQRNVFEYQIAHILFNPRRGGETAALERAQQFLPRLQQPHSFASLAAQFSEDPNFAQGGLLGSFQLREMHPAMAKAIENLDVGEYSEIIRTPAGFHIFKVLSRRLIPDPAFERNRERIREALFAESFRAQFELWLSQLRQDAFIRVNKIDN